MAWVPLLLVVLAHTSGSLIQAALTQPSSLSHRVGETVKITCSGSSYSYGWYQQKVPGSAPVTVIYANSNRPLNIPSRFSGSLSGSTATLTITGVQAEDEADYYCVDWDVFGSGTRVTVISQPEVSPTLYVFQPPSEQILKENKAILVCLIQGFYPGHVEVEWVADGTVLTNNVQTSQPVRQSDSKYMASSYLSLTPKQWQSYSTYSCKVKHEAGNVEKTVNRS
ncbi:immunoglobulin lambda-1 light chain-like [Manacus candei]|uniref:immunoglobulin lambda-1 light chain-like n=1 Tax=Manacus candei TaxID=415023 RepID=UPI0022270E4B|nr:immunoglobulin lambda-1 light chain-like [Manacus candei]